ncbi:MAG: YolD-like family protein [Acholeplasmataceae bacterium]
MDNIYIDRGIIKWAPFDALSGYQTLFDDLKRRLTAKEKPLLSDDMYQALNENLMRALETKASIKLTYFKAHSIYQVTGTITAVDWVYKRLVINDQLKLKSDDIIAIDL